MKDSLKELIELLRFSEVLITYRKTDQQENCLEKYFIKACENFCDNESGLLRLISCAEEKEEHIHESLICGYRTFGSTHDMSRVSDSQKIKEDFQLYKNKAINFQNFEDFYFDPEVDLQKLKVCATLEMSSLNELEDHSEEALLRLKTFWKNQIELHRHQTIQHIDTELLHNSMFDRETIEEIKNLVLEYDPDSELSQIQTKQELFEFWPTLLLPAPDFINDIFADLFRFKNV
jgi:hypothetical protein